MRINKDFIIAIIALFTFTSISSAQITNQDEMIKRRAAEKVAQMNDYISFMASKKKAYKNRKYYSEKALNLFIGRGYDYEENGINKKGVMMEITSIRKTSVSHKLVRDYFNNLINLNYSDVKITSTEIANIKVSNLQQISEDTYVCTCQYDQAFVGYRDGRPLYKDITTKRIKCYIKAEDTEDGTEYIIMLGDITALQTKKL